MSTEEIIQEAQALPPAERAAVIDSLLRSLNPPNPQTDAQWVSVARERLEDYRSGRIEAIPGEDVIARIERRFRSE